MTTQEFVKTVAVRNTLSALDNPSSYGISGYEEWFDLLTGDTPFEDLPESLQEDLGSAGDLRNYAEDLNEMYSVVMDTLRWVKESGCVDKLLEGVE